MNVKRRRHETRKEKSCTRGNVGDNGFGFFFLFEAFHRPLDLLLRFITEKKKYEENRYYVTNNCCMFG